MPRITYNSVLLLVDPPNSTTSDAETDSHLVVDDDDIRMTDSMLTTRYQYREETHMLGQKVMIDLSTLKEGNDSNNNNNNKSTLLLDGYPPRSIHMPVKGIGCDYDEATSENPRKYYLWINHYAGSTQQFFSRKHDARRTAKPLVKKTKNPEEKDAVDAADDVSDQYRDSNFDLEKYYTKSGSDGETYDPTAANWIRGFIRQVGRDRAKVLLAGVGQVHYKDEW